MSSFGQNRLFLKTLFIKNFRNISEMNISFGPDHNLLVGPNGHGKTNCLEAITLACSLRPMQALQNTDLIKFHEPQAKIMASFHDAHKIEVDILKPGKKARINGHPIKNAAKLQDLSPVVTFIPAELTMIAGATSLRRRALDQATVGLFSEHITALKSYEKILLHRNHLLKTWPLDHKTLNTFTEMLIKEGALVIFSRLKALSQMAEIFSKTISSILGLGQVGRIRYVINDQDIDQQTISDLMALLHQHRALMEMQETRRKVTLFGPHLDDIVFDINGIDAKKSASRGQSRAIVLAFKMAEMIAINQIRGIAPIIVLDDIVSELDGDKKSNLVQLINDLKTQVFFSTTDIITFGNHIHSGRIYHVSEGIIKPHQ